MTSPTTMLTGSRPAEAHRIRELVDATPTPSDRWAQGDLGRSVWQDGRWTTYTCDPETGDFDIGPLGGFIVAAWEPEFSEITHGEVAPPKRYGIAWEPPSDYEAALVEQHPRVSGQSPGAVTDHLARNEDHPDDARVSGQSPGAVTDHLARNEDHPDDALFLTPHDIFTSTPDTDWLVPGVLARGVVTQLAGRPKAGKTIMTLAMIRAGLSGGRFLGKDVTYDAVVYASEQGRQSLKEQLSMSSIGVDVVKGLHLLPMGSVAQQDWKGRLRGIEGYLTRRFDGQRVILVIDTLSAWARLTESQENDAGAVLNAYEPLISLTQRLNVATLVIRHAGKGGGDDPSGAARGSNAGDGAADVLLTLSKPVGRPAHDRQVRVLHGIGRLDGIPDEVTAELINGEYLLIGEDAVDEEERVQSSVMAALQDGTTMTMEELERKTSATRTTLRRARDHLIRCDIVERLGDGHRGSPYRYALSGQTVHEGAEPEREVSGQTLPVYGDGTLDLPIEEDFPRSAWNTDDEEGSP